jgi:phosphoglycolate phosphatase
MRRGSVSEQLVLWDIDGTLLNADGVGRDLYDVVFVQLFGRSIDAFAPMAGRTDRAIILETLTMAGVDEPRRYVDPFIAGLTAHAPSVREMVAVRGRALPGASEVLRGLQGRAHQSVLTGNIRPVAEVKLAAVGLRDALDLCIGAYGDDHEVRAELVPVARRRAAAVHGKSPAEFDGGATVVIGDTPLDIEAALASGARAVGALSVTVLGCRLRLRFSAAVLGCRPWLLICRVREGGAGRRARRERTGVALSGQCGVHLPGRAAPFAGDVHPAVPQGGADGRRGVVVPVLIAAPVLRRVVLLPVELDDELVLLVVPVAVSPAAVGLGESDLLGGLGQPVRLLDVAVVAVLEDGVRAARSGPDDLIEVAAPAELLPCGRYLPEPSLAYLSLGEPAGYTSDDVVEIGRGVHQIDDRLLGEGVRRDAPDKSPAEGQVGRHMNDHAFGLCDAPVRRDGHVDEGRLAIGEAVDFCGGLVAQLGAGAGREDGRPQLRVPGQRAGEGRVDTGVDALPAAESDSGDDGAI